MMNFFLFLDLESEYEVMENKWRMGGNVQSQAMRGLSLGNKWSSNPKEPCFNDHELGTNAMFQDKYQSQRRVILLIK